MPNPAVDEVLRHHDTDHLVPTWRSEDEHDQWDWHDRVVETAYFLRAMGVAFAIIGCAMTAGTYFDIPQGGDTTVRAATTVFTFLAAAFTFIGATRGLNNARRQQAVVAPFITTPAAAWAYRAMLDNPSSDHARAEQFRRALHDHSAADQVRRPEHAALLTLGHAAASPAA